MRSIARFPLVLLFVVMAALLAGCGSDDSSSKDDGDKRAATTEQAEDAAGKVKAVDAKLEIELTNMGSPKGAGIPIPTDLACTRSIPATCHASVECPPAEPVDDHDIALCTWLAETGSDLLLVEPDPAQMCTEQYGGPEVATVTGTLDGKKVNATFSREDGCAIGRFDEASPLWSREALATATATTTNTDGGAASGSCPALDPDAPVSSTDGPGAKGAADEVCAAPTTPPAAPGTKIAPPVEPEIISDPPEAFE